jgi:hypothetical protein
MVRGGRRAVIVVGIFLALASTAAAGFNVTDEHTGQTFDALTYLNNAYPCDAPCAFTFTARLSCFGSPAHFNWLIRDASGQLIATPTGDPSHPWHYDFTALGYYSVLEFEQNGECGTGATFRLQVLDRTPPATTITSGPRSVTEDATPTFVFGANEAGSTFRCSLDGAVAGPCTSPLTTPRLANGSHRLAVQAFDPAGNADPTPAVFTFRVAHYVNIDPRIAATWSHEGDAVGVARLHVTNVPSKGSVLVVCRRGGCPFSRRVVKPTNRIARLERLFGTARLRPGARIDVTVRAPDAIAKVFRFRFARAGHDPIRRVLCQTPGAAQPAAC